jgi:hypothetical protein
MTSRDEIENEAVENAYGVLERVFPYIAEEHREMRKTANGLLVLDAVAYLFDVIEKHEPSTIIAFKRGYDAGVRRQKAEQQKKTDRRSKVKR